MPGPAGFSGLSDAEGEEHPTHGGLRIGKPLPERGRFEPFDEALEWERDGQYFHYLTKWMHALGRVARDVGEPRHGAWARELLVAAHHGFTVETPRGRRMIWKASIDLSRPLVSSMGQHDPLDGFITALELDPEKRELGDAIGDFVSMLRGAVLETDDPLGIGGLLVDAFRLTALAEQGAREPALRLAVLDAALQGLTNFAGRFDFNGPASRRLAFRELGLAIGLARVKRLGSSAALLQRFLPLGERIEAFWLDDENRRSRTFLEHRNINDVMLASRLLLWNE